MTQRDETPTTPPGPADEAADEFARACREHEWDARLGNVARLHRFEGHGRLEDAE